MSVYFFNTTAGTPQNLQQTLTAGSVLTSSHIVDCGGFAFSYINFNSISFKSYNDNGFSFTGASNWEFGSGNNDGIKILGDASRIYTEYTNVLGNKFNNGFDFDISKDSYIIGDCNATPTLPYIQINGSAAPSRLIEINAFDAIQITTDLIQYIETTPGSLITASGGAPNGDHLKITIDGTPYVIELRV